MATKPTLANARFGETVGGSTVGANLTAPSSGLRDTGFQPSTPAVAAYVNWLCHELYLWAKYVDEGVIDGDITCDNLHVLGDADIDDDLNVDGDITVDGRIIETLANSVTICPLKGSGVFSTSSTGNQAEALIPDVGGDAIFPLDAGLDEHCLISAVTITGYTLASQPTITFDWSGSNKTYTTSGSYGVGASNKTYTFDTPFAISAGVLSVKVVSGTNDFHFMRATITYTRP